MKQLILAFILISTSIPSYSENIEPAGRFMRDTTLIGEPIKYILTVKHNSELQILFPDTTYNFFPFELISKEFFPTKTKNNRSIDSAIYILRTFDLSPFQKLSLPVYVFSQNDSAAIFSNEDSIFLKETFAGMPSLTLLKEETSFNKIKEDINYPYIIAHFLLGFGLLALLYKLFGKNISRRYKMFKIRSDHMAYIKNFQKAEKEFVEYRNITAIEQALSAWKYYLTKLENIPINTYTTTEIINLYNKEALKNSLNIIDRAVYGGLISEEADKALVTLKRFSKRSYHKRKKEIQNV